MKNIPDYITPSVKVLTVETEQFCALNVVSGSGSSAGGKILQNGATETQPAPVIWI